MGDKLKFAITVLAGALTCVILLVSINLIGGKLNPVRVWTGFVGVISLAGVGLTWLLIIVGFFKAFNWLAAKFS